MVFWSRLIAGGVVLFPLSLNHIDFRAVFSHGLSVAAHRSSPAYAAFEDLKETYPAESEIPDRAVMLASGTSFDYKSASKLPRVRQIAMKGMTVRQPVVAEPKPVLVAGHTVTRAYRAAAIPAPESSYHADPHDDAWSIGTVAAHAKKLVDQEIKSASRFASSRTIQTSTGTPIYIARGDMPVATEPGAGRGLPEGPAPEEIGTFVTHFSPLNTDAANQRPLWLNGEIEMTGGLAFVGADTPIQVKRVVNGTTYETGRIWVKDAKFEIHVKKPVGFLVAELYTRDGRVLGRGELNLMDLHDISPNGGRISDLRIALRPTTDTASLRPIDDYSPSSSPTAVADARVEIQAYNDPQPVNDDGYVSEPTLDKDSTFVARAVAKKHWSSVVVGQAGRPQDIRLFSNSLVEALVNLTQEGTDRAEAFHMSVVWGQISRDGEAVAGAQVEMAGDYQPVYFNEAYLPDKRLTSTSKNGLFAFLRVRPGVQAVRVKAKGHMYPAQVFPTEDKHVSYVELSLRDKVVSQFKVLDVLDMNKPVSARIKMVGTEAMLSLSGDEFAEYAVAADTFMIEAEAGPEYEISRTTLTGAPHLVHVPLIKRDWLRELAAERGLTLNPARGIVVGFVDDQDFEIEMTGYGPHEQPQIVYFDAQGRPVPGNAGVAGGGFAIYNAAPGLQTVYIHPVQSRGSFSQIVVAEPDYVHVMTWSATRAR